MKNKIIIFLVIVIVLSIVIGVSIKTKKNNSNEELLSQKTIESKKINNYRFLSESEILGDDKIKIINKLESENARGVKYQRNIKINMP